MRLRDKINSDVFFPTVQERLKYRTRSSIAYYLSFEGAGMDERVARGRAKDFVGNTSFVPADAALA